MCYSCCSLRVCSSPSEQPGVDPGRVFLLQASLRSGLNAQCSQSFLLCVSVRPLKFLPGSLFVDFPGRCFSFLLGVFLSVQVGRPGTVLPECCWRWVAFLRAYLGFHCRPYSISSAAVRSQADKSCSSRFCCHSCWCYRWRAA
jgi:hypothetical protein